jgi:hypothetical protein
MRGIHEVTGGDSLHITSCPFEKIKVDPNMAKPAFATKRQRTKTRFFGSKESAGPSSTSSTHFLRRSFSSESASSSSGLDRDVRRRSTFSTLYVSDCIAGDLKM